MKRLLLVVGTRPNYIKITRFRDVVDSHYKDEFDIKIVHTGQHYDKAMASDFFAQLNISPDFLLEPPKGSPNNQIATIMIGLEKVIVNFEPDLIIVPGDVNSTLAAAITANKMNVPLAHIESGLRSFDRTMPEEVNRILVDELSDIYFVTEESGFQNLINEGKPNSKIHFVGNTMIDTLVHFKEQIETSDLTDTYDLRLGDYILLTIHRPATVDFEEGLTQLIELLQTISQKHQVVFPIHPRTLNNIKKLGLFYKLEQLNDLLILPPLDYFKFQYLIGNAKLVITDSGGIQEETTYLKKPCLTLRPNTERPITITEGTNLLLDFNKDKIMKHIDEVCDGIFKEGQVPKKWDGKATERILQVLYDTMN